VILGFNELSLKDAKWWEKTQAMTKRVVQKEFGRGVPGVGHCGKIKGMVGAMLC